MFTNRPEFNVRRKLWPHSCDIGGELTGRDDMVRSYGVDGTRKEIAVRLVLTSATVAPTRVTPNQIAT